MLRSINIARLSIMAAMTFVACLLISSAPAEAQWRGHRGGIGVRVHHAQPARVAYRPVYRPHIVQRQVYRPYYRPRFVAAPVYAPYPVYGYRCVIRKRWVAGRFGWHVVRRRVCF